MREDPFGGRVKFTTAAVSLAVVVGATLSGATAANAVEVSASVQKSAVPSVSAQAYPKRNWVHLNNNAIGVVFHPNGDYFDVYYNRAQSVARIFWRYSNSNTAHSVYLSSTGHYPHIHKGNIAEKRYIIFGACNTETCASAEYYNG
jgi:hypothetical protein